MNKQGCYIATLRDGVGALEHFREALFVAEVVCKQHLIPYLPQLTMFWELEYEHSGEFWRELDRHWLSKSDMVLLLAEDKHQTARRWARYHGKPVFRYEGSLEEEPLTIELQSFLRTHGWR